MPLILYGFYFSSFFLISLSVFNPGLTTQIPVNQMPCRGATDYGSGHSSDNISAGLPECVQYNARATARDNTKDTHPVPRKRLKTLTSPGMQPAIPGSKEHN